MPRQLEQPVHAVAGLHLAGALDVMIDEVHTLGPSLRDRRPATHGGRVQR